MTVSRNAVMVRHPILVGIQVSTANTNLDGTTGTYALLFECLQTRYPNGVRIEEFYATATVTTTAGWIAIFFQSPTGQRLLWDMIKIDAITIAAGTMAEKDSTWSRKLGVVIFPPGWSIYVTTRNAEAINVWMYAFDHEHEE